MYRHSLARISRSRSQPHCFTGLAVLRFPVGVTRCIYLGHVRASVDVNGLAGDPLRLGARQERHDTGNVVWEPRASQRAPRRSRRVDFLHAHLVSPRDVMPGIFRVHVRLDASRRDAVDRDAPTAEVVGQALGHAEDRRLGCRVECMVWYPLLSYVSLCM